MGQDKGEMGQDEDEQTGGAGLGNGGRDWGREETLKAQAELGTLGGPRAESREQHRGTEAGPRGRPGEKKVGAGALVGVAWGRG